MSTMNYFAADKDPRKLISKVERDISLWGATMSANNAMGSLFQSYWRNWAAYYSPLITPDSWMSSLGFQGKQGELIKMVIPEARTLVRQHMSLTTKQKLQCEVVTEVDDADPIMTCKIGKGIANHEVKCQRLDQLQEIIAETVSVVGTCFASCTWRSDKGYPYSRNPENMDSLVYSGANQIEWHDMYDVVWDWSTPFKDLDYITVKRRVNRWNLVAQYPKLAQKIKSLPSARQERLALANFNFLMGYENDDMIYVREFYHKPTPALPGGRMTVWGSADCIFLDTFENPYEGLPVEQFTYETITNTSLGYPWFANLLPAQEIMDGVFSAMGTNFDAHGVQSVLVPKGADIAVTDIKGRRFITYTPQNADGGGKPEPMQLTANPPDAYKFLDMLNNHLGNLSMINSTLRGQPPANVSSGAMAATLSANSLEFLNQGAKVIALGMQNLLNRAIQNYQSFADVEQIVEIVGEGNIAYVKEFTMDEVRAIKRIEVKETNPILGSVAGRIQIADAVMPQLAQGNYKAVNAYLAIMQGAPEDILTDDRFKEEIAVQQEVDALLEGKPVMPLILDNHPLYIQSYLKATSNPSVRISGKQYADILAIMQERARLELEFKATMPDLYAMLRGLPPPPPPGAGMGGAMPPPGGQVGQGQIEPGGVAGVAAPAQPAEPEM